jgi:hypothetical protein
MASEYCVPSCNVQWIGDGGCDEVCYNEACSWDKDDCSIATPEPYEYGSGDYYGELGGGGETVGGDLAMDVHNAVSLLGHPIACL